MSTFKFGVIIVETGVITYCVSSFMVWFFVRVKIIICHRHKVSSFVFCVLLFFFVQKSNYFRSAISRFHIFPTKMSNCYSLFASAIRFANAQHNGIWFISLSMSPLICWERSKHEKHHKTIFPWNGKGKIEEKRNKGRLIVSKAVTRLRVNWIFPFVPFTSFLPHRLSFSCLTTVSPSLLPFLFPFLVFKV